VVIAALLVTVAEAQPGMMPGWNQLHMERPGDRILTCRLDFPDANDPSTISNSIAVNIRQKYDFGSHGTKKHGLEAKISVFSATGGKVTVAITETGSPEDGCVAESFGRFLRSMKPRGPPITPKITPMFDKYGLGGIGWMDGMSGYGWSSPNARRGPGGIGGMGHMSMMGMGDPWMMGIDFNNPRMGMMGYNNREHHGVIASTEVAPGFKASIKINNLKNFDRLEQIAGRGVVVCPSDNIRLDFNMDSRCDGGILSCCALHYSHQEVHLGGNSPTMAHQEVHNPLDTQLQQQNYRMEDPISS